MTRELPKSVKLIRLEAIRTAIFAAGDSPRLSVYEVLDLLDNVVALLVEDEEQMGKLLAETFEERR